MARIIPEQHKRIYEELCLYIKKCTSHAGSLNNYTDFKRVNECITEISSNPNASILDYEDPEVFVSVVKQLKTNKRYQEYNKKGNNQYSSTVLNYLDFLRARKFMIESGALEKANEPAKDSRDFLISLHESHKVNIGVEQVLPPSPINEPLQQIFYGAPGTGKSHKVDEMCKAYSNHRTTFHPDSDYSTFVGCYKPTKVKVDKKPLLNFNELADKLREYRTKDNETNAQVAFGYDYYQSLREVDNLGKLLLASGGAEYDTYLSAGMLIAKKEEGTKKAGDITYSFTPQAFTNAYVEAWQKFEKNEPVLLVIEEINRGNCAQIFGDLFQLLDRNEDGYSTYPIEPDTDLGTYISEQGLNVQNAILKKKDGTTEDISGDINQGKKLVLPPNLYIWATMNTSDQSLFPIDSAFKRRWDWKYVPIDTEKENWAIEVNGKKYSWTSFLNIINEKIYEKTESEDKCLGFYFCKAENNVISASKFVSKVLFYLYNDVFKDYGFDEDFFKDEDSSTISFRKFYKGLDMICEEKVEKILMNLNVELYKEGKEEEDGGSEVEEDETTAETFPGEE